MLHVRARAFAPLTWKDRKPLAQALRPIYAAASAEAAAAALDAGDPILCVPAGDPAGDLHHQRDRERERAGAQDHQDARPFSDRRRGQQADLAGAAQHYRRMGPAGASLEGGDEPVRDPVRRRFGAAG